MHRNVLVNFVENMIPNFEILCKFFSGILGFNDMVANVSVIGGNYTIISHRYNYYKELPNDRGKLGSSL